jgi:hypothetical protein
MSLLIFIRLIDSTYNGHAPVASKQAASWQYTAGINTAFWKCCCNQAYLGPDPRSLMSLPIFIRLTASVLSAPAVKKHS